MKTKRAALVATMVLTSACGPEPGPLDTEQDAVVRSGGLVPFGRVRILDGVADPDAFVADGKVYVTGTYDARVLPVWRLEAGGFIEHARYDPSATDDAFDYCHVWAPDLIRVGTTWILAFAGTQAPRGTNCANQPAHQQVLYAVATDDRLIFGAPVRVDLGPGAPRSTPDDACPRDGCDKALRIDPSLFADADGRLYLSYTWFQDGNHNATIALDDPTRIVHNTDPSRPDEERINEAPEIFERNGTYYFLYSTGDFRGKYRLRYIMADSVDGLTKDRGFHELTTPVLRRDGRKYETAGHGSIVEYGGQHYAVYHVSEMSEAGDIVRRDTVVSPVFFEPDGRMRSLNALQLEWSALPGREYSVDVRAGGRWFAPCVDAGILRQSTQAVLTDLCPSGDRLAPLETVDRIRVCHTAGGDWARAKCTEQPFAGGADRLFVPLSL